MNFIIVHFDTLESTNTEAADRARQGADEGLCIVADEQTAGRGRQGREWISKKGSGVFMSLVLRPKLGANHLTLLPLMAAIAVHDVLIKRSPAEPDIKWPNDILVCEKKICGILCETVDTPLGLSVILGIGINTSAGQLPENATSIESEATFPAVRDEIVNAVTEQLDIYYELLRSDPSAIVEEWRLRSSYFEGKNVNVQSGNETFTGLTCGLEANGALRVRTADGLLKIVQAGDVERLRSAD